MIMEREILSLYKDSPKLKETLIKYPSNQLNEFLTSLLIESEENEDAVLKAILSGLSDQEDETCAKRLKVLRHIISAMCAKDCLRRNVETIVMVLIYYIESASKQDLLYIFDFFLDIIKKGAPKSVRVFDILSKLVITLQNEIEKEDSDEKKEDTFTKLCSSNWHPSNAVPLATVFSSSALTKKQNELLLRKLLGILKLQELNQLPAMVYQILLISAEGDYKNGFEGIIDYFTNLDGPSTSNDVSRSSRSSVGARLSDKINPNQLLQIEGTVLLHCLYSIKQNQTLGKHILKIIKNYSSDCIQTFLFPLLLTISSIPRLQEQVLDYLYSCITKCFASAHSCQESALIRNFSEGACNVEESVLKIVQKCCSGKWDCVCEGLVTLSFVLLHNSTSKSYPGGFPSKSTSSKPSNLEGLRGRGQLAAVVSGVDEQGEKACQLAMQIVVKLFKNLEGVRNEILDRIVKNIISHATKPSVHVYLELLAELAVVHPDELISSLSRLRGLIDSLVQLTAPAAVGLVHALVPLARTCPPLRDQLLITLRKAVFTRNPEAQKMSVASLLLLLKHFKVSVLDSSASHSEDPFTLSQFSQLSSQVSTSSLLVGDNLANDALCAEILTLVKRSLAHSVEIKEILYKGLFDVLTCNQPMSGKIVSLLFHQLSAHLSPNQSAVPPLKLVDNIKMNEDGIFKCEEPLDVLIYYLQKSVRHCEKAFPGDPLDDPGNHSSSDVHRVVPIAATCLDSLTKRMAQTQVEDFDLRQNSDYSMSTAIGKRNCALLKMLVRIFDACIEYHVEEGGLEGSKKLPELVLTMFSRQEAVRKLLRDKASGAKKGGHSSESSENSLFSLSSIANCLELCLTSEHPDETPDDENDDIIDMTSSSQFAGQLLNQAVNQVGRLGSQKRITTRNRADILTSLGQLGRVTLRYYHSTLVKIDGNDDSQSDTKVHRSLMLSSLNVFNLVFKCICSYLRKKLPDFIEYLWLDNLTDFDANGRKTLSTLAKLIKTWIIRLLDQAVHEKSLQRHLIYLMPLMVDLCRERLGLGGGGSVSLAPEATSTQAPPPGITENLLPVHTWITNVLKKWNAQQLDDVTVMKQMTSQCLLLMRNVASGRARDSGESTDEMLVQLAEDLHIKMHDIDQNAVQTGKITFELVTDKSASHLLPVLVTSVNSCLDDVTWLLNKMRYAFTEPKDQENEMRDAESQMDTSVVQGIAKASQSCVRMDAALCHRMDLICRTVDHLVQCAVTPGYQTDALLRTLTRLYTTLTNITKHYYTILKEGRGTFSKRFERLVKISGSKLSPHCYAFISYVQETECEKARELLEKKNQKKKTKNGKPVASIGQTKKNNTFTTQLSRSVKDSRVIPNLIYTVEQYERFLVLLTKKSKINLMEHVKMSMSRDFRINQEAIQQVLDHSESEEEIGDDEESETQGSAVNASTISYHPAITRN